MIKKNKHSKKVYPSCQSTPATDTLIVLDLTNIPTEINIPVEAKIPDVQPTKQQPVEPVDPVHPTQTIHPTQTVVPVVPVVPIAPVVPVDKLTKYHCYTISNINEVYIQLLNDNIAYLIRYIYQNTDKSPYDSAEVRIGVSLQMILSSDHLIPLDVSSKIAKDIDQLRKDNTYTSKWENPSTKRKVLTHELELLRRHTEIDDSISLNLSEQPHNNDEFNIDDFDIHSGISTLNVSVTCPIENERTACQIM